MKKSLWKNNFKEINKTRRRFISILVLAFLGVGFFSGLVAAGPDMNESLDIYVDSSNLHDVEIISTLGLTDDDIESLKEIENVDNIEGIKTKDTIIRIDEAESIAKILEYNSQMNTPAIIEGRLPENSSECLLDNAYTIFDSSTNYIGKKVIFENDEVNSDDKPVFTRKEFTIVGTCISPLYISSERGTTSIGNGNIDLYIYTKGDVINLDYYTAIDLNVKNTKKLLTNSDEYLNLVDSVINRIEDIKDSRENARYNQLVDDATSELSDAQKDFDKEKSKVNKELKDAQKQLDDATKKIEKSEKDIKKSEKQLTTEKNNTKKKFEDAQKQIENAQKQLTNSKSELKTAKSEFNKNKESANENLEKIKAGIEETNTNIKLLEEKKKQLEQNQLDTSEIDSLLSNAKLTLNTLNGQKEKIEIELSNAQKLITKSEEQINAGEKELKNQKISLTNAKKVAENKFNEADKKIEDGKKAIEKAKKELQDKKNEYEDAKKEAEDKINDAEKDLKEAKNEIEKIEKAKWYIQDRKDNSGYMNVIDATNSITNLSKMFPAIFYIIAILISLTSMTRMIEEERVEIGTLKALGYTNFQIIIKYILYALLACIIGGVLGMTVGFYLIPNIIWTLYSLLYKIPKFYAFYRINIGVLGLIISFICIGGATIFVAIRELKNMPAVLMRPKAPKNGKKIFMERITFIWKRLNFSRKVTFRNIFRYKKRTLMTIIGIAGCTGLMLTGFGIKDSVTDIPEGQFGKIFKYEISVTLSDTNNLKEVKNELDRNEHITDYSEIYASMCSLTNGDKKYDVTVFVPKNNDDFDNVCSLLNADNEYEKIKLSSDGIVITDKVSKLLSANVGDNITLIDSDNIEHTFKISGVAENYVSHYVYMSKEMYETMNKSYDTNMILVNSNEMSEEEQHTLSEKLLEIDNVAGVSLSSDIIKTVDDMLDSLNYVILILIVSSALLDFVVLYNLANINIGERQREIATLKVLGFYDKEVDNYINKENVVFTVIGIILGIAFGYFLTKLIITTVEIESLRFVRRILPISYVYSVVMTFVFSIIVNYIIHFILKKIDMVESLKSVE